jgi:hypothetical protein
VLGKPPLAYFQDLRVEHVAHLFGKLEWQHRPSACSC